VSNDFERGPRVENRNHSRQHELAMEDEGWLTQGCWFRLATTLAGTCVTDYWKMVKFHVSASHPYSTLTIKDFAEILIKTLVHNGLHDHDVPAERRGRTISVPLAEPNRILQEERVHVPGSFGRYEKGRSKQARCLRCYCDEGVLNWTSFYYVQCGIPLCMPSSRHSRNGFEHHMRLDPVALGNMKRVRTG
jgi:hypothetical protein